MVAHWPGSLASIVREHQLVSHVSDGPACKGQRQFVHRPALIAHRLDTTLLLPTQQVKIERALA